MPVDPLSRALGGGALLVAGIALAVSLADGGPRRASDAAPGAPGVAHAERLADVERRLIRLEARLAQPTLSPDGAIRDEIDGLRSEITRLSGRSPGEAPASLGTEAPRARRRFSALSPRQAGITVVESDDGALQVTNTDPALTGQYLVVPAVGLDGQPTEVTITAPPP